MIAKYKNSRRSWKSEEIRIDKKVTPSKEEDFKYENDLNSYSSIFESLTQVDVTKNKEEEKDQIYMKILKKIIDDP